MAPNWTDHIEGTLSADDLRRAFVMGAKWWEWRQTGATMWPSDRRSAEAKAEEVFPGGRPPNNEIKLTHGESDRIEDVSSDECLFDDIVGW